MVAWRDPKIIANASQFLALVESENSGWRVETAAPEPDADTGLPKIIFFLERDAGRLATVERSPGGLLVCFRDAPGKPHDDYCFELDRLHEHRQRGNWSWQQHIAGKYWTQPVHLTLLDALDQLFPFDGHRAHRTRRPS